MKTKRENNLQVINTGNQTIYDRVTDGYKTMHGRKIQVRRAVPFNLNAALRKHVSRGDNVGIYFYQAGCKMVAFDFDCDDSSGSDNPILDAGKSAKLMVGVAHALGLAPFVYFSGGKGFHVEIFFDKAISINKLNTLNNILLRKHHDLGGRHVDCTYPSGRAYRIFGCYHYKTGDFTNAYKPIFDEENKLTRMTPLEPAESWELFSRTPFNDPEIVDKIISDHPDVGKYSKSKKSKVKVSDGEYAPSPHCWDMDVLKQLHEMGLFAPYTRYNTSYHLGRYFKYVLKIDTGEAEKEIKSWLKRHFSDQCNDYNGLAPFEGADKAVKTAYALCEVETLRNCMLGFKEGKPFKREAVEIFCNEAVSYIRSLGYSRKKETALLTLLDKAVEFGALHMGFGYIELLGLFNVKSKSSVSEWLKEFQADGILVRTVKGFFNTTTGKGKTAKYHLVLPENCYRVIDCNDANND